MDYYDRSQIEEKVENSRKKTTREIEQLRKDTQDGFNRVASALEALTKEIKGLRADLNPKLDKPAKLPAPAKMVEP